MLTRRSCRGLCAALFAVVLAAGATPTLAVGDLRSALVRATDVPRRASAPQVKLYPRFAGRLIINAHRNDYVDCATPSAIRQSQWEQGMIELISRRPVDSYLLCGWLLKTGQSAHTAYRSAVQQISRNLHLAQAIKQKKMRPLFPRRIGNESLGISISPSGVGSYVLVFRHGNAVVMLQYLGWGALSPGKFLDLGTQIDHRLR